VDKKPDSDHRAVASEWVNSWQLCAVAGLDSHQIKTRLKLY